MATETIRQGWAGKLNSNGRKICILLIFAGFLGGCGDKFFDPTQVGRFRVVPSVNVILDSLGVAEEAPSAWVGAEEPRPGDLIIYETDYIFSPGDIVRVAIFELRQEGVIFASDYVVTETGKISIPEVGIVEAAGLTESQLEEEIMRILTPGILREPSVTVTLISSQQRMFSILGDGVPGPGRYQIPRYDFRLTDALAVAGGPRQFNVSYIYVSRPVTGGEPITEPFEPESGQLQVFSPQASRRWAENNLLICSAELVTDSELAELARPEGLEIARQKESEEQIEYDQPPPAETDSGLPQITEPLIEPEETGRIEWVFQEGKWVPIQVGRPQEPEPVVKPLPSRAKSPAEDDLEWDEITGQTAAAQARVVEIPTDRLRAGDPRYNIVIRPGDTIHVPVDIIGEFCIMGNTNSQGFIELTGRPMTLKMAIAAAGGLGPLAWPKKCEVVRRLGKNKEEIVMVDLDKIASGEQPDFFIKPNDLINVGTHTTARWRAVLRNAFRATYGFGFIYDRNFADRDFGTSRPIPNIF
ncbi:MAG: polysaccharide biosynthesis/export family protein [Planctomycetota bacterium]|jgi:polysaccharide export outer membrane protein